MSLSHSPSIVTNGLVLCLDAANTKSYPGTGTTWTDLSGNSNNATLTDGPTFSSLNNGYIVFDGVNDVVTTSVFDDNTSTRTFSAWHYPTTVSNNSTHALVRGRDGFGNGWNLRLGFDNTSGDRYRAGVVISSTSYSAYSTTTALLNQWVYLTGVFISSTSIKLYVNGILEGTTSVPAGSLRTSTVGWAIGSSTSTAFSAMSASHLSVYNRELTDAEIFQNFNALRGRYGL
jgi:hypothetical protein